MQRFFPIMEESKSKQDHQKGFERRSVNAKRAERGAARRITSRQYIQDKLQEEDVACLNSGQKMSQGTKNKKRTTNPKRLDERDQSTCRASRTSSRSQLTKKRESGKREESKGRAAIPSRCEIFLVGDRGKGGMSGGGKRGGPLPMGHGLQQQILKGKGGPEGVLTHYWDFGRPVSHLTRFCKIYPGEKDLTFPCAHGCLSAWAHKKLGGC